jgi:hypothetical protein
MLHVSVLGRVCLENSAWLEGWLAAEPDSPHAAVVRASSLLDQAGRARGGAYASQTSREQLEAFTRINGEADDAARRAVALAPEDPTPWVCRMSAALGQPIFHEQFTGLWNQAFSRAPMHRRAHSYAHQYWLAKWYGSEELSAKFVADAVARAPRTPLAFELSVHRAMESWLVFRSKVKVATTSRTYFQAGGRDYIAAALAQWDGELPTGGPLETVDRNLLAWTLTMAGRYDEACDVFQAIGGRSCFGFPWHYERDPIEAFGRVRRWAIEGSLRRPVK